MTTCHRERLACPCLTIGQDGPSIAIQHLGGDLTSTLGIDHLLTRIVEVLRKSVCLILLLCVCWQACVSVYVCMGSTALVPYLVGSSSLAVGC